LLRLYIDWKSKSEHDKLLKSEDLKASVAAGLGELSDMAATPPLISMNFNGVYISLKVTNTS
jgi:hypothetical protein